MNYLNSIMSAMEFNEITMEQYKALAQINKENKTKYRKTAINSIIELENENFPLKYKYILITILKMLKMDINMVVKDEETVILHLDSTYELVWRIINEFTALVKIKLEGKPISAGDKTLVSGQYIDYIKATTAETSTKTIILVTLINLFSDKKIEQDVPFNSKNTYIHKKLNILLNSIVLYDQKKY